VRLGLLLNSDSTAKRVSALCFCNISENRDFTDTGFIKHFVGAACYFAERRDKGIRKNIGCGDFSIRSPNIASSPKNIEKFVIWRSLEKWKNDAIQQMQKIAKSKPKHCGFYG
jgi:hypothetical protein